MRNILYIILLFIASVAYGQNHTKAIISDIQFYHDSIINNVVVSYKLSNTKPSDKITLSIEAQKINTYPPLPLYENVTKLNVKTLSGEISNISSDGIKTVKWDQRSDGYILDDTLQLKISAYAIPKISTLKHIERSLLFPGLGDYRIRNGWYYCAYGLISYGLVASSIYFNVQAQSNYNLYKNSYDITRSDNLFLQSKQQYQLSVISGSAAAAIWVFDLGGILLKSRKVKKEITPKNSKYYYKQSLQPVIAYSDAIYINTQTPFEKATIIANKLFDDKKYYEALNEYKKALVFNPNDEFTKNIIIEITDTLAAITAKEELYQNLVKEADTLYAKEIYQKSLEHYGMALNMKPENPILKNRMAEITTIINQLKTDSLYNELIASAEIELKNKNYDKSIEIFIQAYKTKQNEYPTQKISEIQIILASIKQKEIDDEYNLLIKQADAAFNISQYDKAYDLYNKALTLKYEDYPWTKIEKIEKIRKEIEQKKIDKEYIALLTKADEAMKKREYDKARELYKRATELKPLESYPENQIAAIDNIFSVSKDYGSKQALFNNCEKAVFLILSESKYSSESSKGTGFFISPDGIAISNYHVYNQYNDAVIYTGGEIKSQDKINEDNIFEIESILAQNEKLDYVIFKVKKNYNYQKFPYLKLASQSPEILSEVLAIGNPKGFLKVPSLGDVKQYLAEEDSNIDDFYILTDVDVTFGNSGGPLLNLKGEVVGIITSGIDDGRLGLNYAINIKKIPASKYIK